MREIVEAAVREAAAKGLCATVIVFGPGGAPVAAQALNGPQATPAAPPSGDQALRERHTAAQVTALTQEVQALRQQLGVAEAAVKNAPVMTGGGADPAVLQGVTHERDALRAKVHELEGHIAQLRSQPAAAATANGNGSAAPAPALQDYGLDVLGLDEKIVKLVNKAAGADVRTIRELATLFNAGKIAAKTEKTPAGVFTKDQVIDIANRLLGRVPAALPAGANGAATPTAPAAIVPANVKDRPWIERLRSARKKEKRAQEIRTKMDALRATLAETEKGEQNPDTKKKAADLRAEIDNEDKILGVFDGQAMALLFSCGFDAGLITKAKNSVDAVLKEAGVTVSADEPVPAGAGA